MAHSSDLTNQLRVQGDLDAWSALEIGQVCSAFCANRSRRVLIQIRYPRTQCQGGAKLIWKPSLFRSRSDGCLGIELRRGISRGLQSKGQRHRESTQRARRRATPQGWCRARFRSGFCMANTACLQAHRSRRGKLTISGTRPVPRQTALALRIMGKLSYIQILAQTLQVNVSCRPGAKAADKRHHHRPRCAPPSTCSTSPVTWLASVR